MLNFIDVNKQDTNYLENFENLRNNYKLLAKDSKNFVELFLICESMDYDAKRIISLRQDISNEVLYFLFKNTTDINILQNIIRLESKYNNEYLTIVYKEHCNDSNIVDDVSFKNFLNHFLSVTKCQNTALRFYKIGYIVEEMTYIIPDNLIDEFIFKTINFNTKNICEKVLNNRKISRETQKTLLKCDDWYFRYLMLQVCDIDLIYFSIENGENNFYCIRVIYERLEHNNHYINTLQERSNMFKSWLFANKK